jgi:2-iminobutanoate/2-iminopropanoate deaminase
MPFQAITGKDIPPSSLPFSPAIRANGFVFVSGQASVDETGKIVGDTFANEMHRTMKNIKTILAAAGLDLSDVVQVRSYVREAKDIPEYNTIYREYFKGTLPARTTIVNCLPDIIRFEMDVVAAERK